MKRICFNPDCKNTKSVQFRKGWLLRNGNFVELCDRCAAAFERGKFCDIFHLDADGWRSCESCGKRIHCGCIVSIHAYILLDAGGVDCMACAKRNILTVPNQIWPSSSSLSLRVPGMHKDISVKNWNQTAGLTATSGHWGQPFSMWNTSASQPDLNPMMQYDVDGVRQISESCSSVDKKRLEDPSDRVNSLNIAVMDSLTNANATVSHSLHRDDVSLNGLRGMTYEAHPNACANISLRPPSSKEDASNNHFAAVPYSLPSENNGLHRVSATQSQQQAQSPPMAKQFNANFQNGTDSPGVTQKNTGRIPGDAKGQSQLLSRYWPKITDQELQSISGDSKSVITPLFEKMLSASDAGRVGRLVLPKKCAEAYFPTITHSEGLPLKVQDAKGKEWLLHFRFWPNNNSRMYVLEGITPCIQSMQLQAGDTVTFSRIDPGGKLVMGFRKAARVPSSDQDRRTPKTGGDLKYSEVNKADPAGSLPKNDRSGYIGKDNVGSKSFMPSKKRKNSCRGSKDKRPRIDNEDLIELELTWEEAQALLRPPPDHDSNVMVVDGQPFEEYEEAPILGKPTIITTNQVGEKIQWAQCEDCSKWRKLPISTLLPSRWTCSANELDPERSSCSAAQEVTSKQLEDIVFSNKTEKSAKESDLERNDTDAVEASEEHKNMGSMGEDDPLASAQTTRHPRHRSGCTCIVCSQPPSKGPKHNCTCMCTVCLTVKRRRVSLLKRLSEKETESARKKLEELQLPDNPELDDDLSIIAGADLLQKLTASEHFDDGSDQRKPSSPVIGQIDLNIQPEREDIPSKLLHPSSMARLLSGNHKLHPVLHEPSSLSCDGDLVLNEGGGGEKGAGEELDSEIQHDTFPGDHCGAPDPLHISNSVIVPASS